MIDRNTLVKDLDEKLNISAFSDYGPNGLQIEGHKSISKIAFAVSATQYTINKAVELGADALIVHHGLFWKFHGPKTITGSFFKRVEPLIKNSINLIGYHLPLDAHMELGNAAAIANQIGLKNLAPFGDHKGMPTGVWGEFQEAKSPSILEQDLQGLLEHNIIHSSPNNSPIKTMGIITGGANGDWREAKKLGLDSYLTGEISEHDWHEAQEDGVHFFAGGHNATEQFGVQQLMKYIYEKYPNEKLELFFIPVNNPA